MPGDVVILEAGNVVPADLRLVESAALRVQEAALTGESEPVDKGTGALVEPGLAVGDRTNMTYSGTQVTFGRGRGVVIATGMATELGQIASMLQSVAASRTPLQERLDRVGKQLALGGVAVALVVVVLGALAGEPLSELVLTAISVAVAVIPEGLPAVVTFTLAVGAQRMLRRNALIRKLPAVETLGSVTVICSDKTGTLTQNRMTVTVVDVAGATHLLETSQGMNTGGGLDRAITPVLAAGVLCNDSDAKLDDSGELATIGDPTETALLIAAHRAGIDVPRLRAAAARIGERPFDSDRKRMSTVHARLGAAAPCRAGWAASGRTARVRQGRRRRPAAPHDRGAHDRRRRRPNRRDARSDHVRQRSDGLAGDAGPRRRLSDPDRPLVPRARRGRPGPARPHRHDRPAAARGA